MWKMDTLCPTENIFNMHCPAMCETQFEHLTFQSSKVTEHAACLPWLIRWCFPNACAPTSFSFTQEWGKGIMEADRSACYHKEHVRV